MILLTSCATKTVEQTVKYKILIPTKVERPAKPIYYKLEEKNYFTLEDINKLQKNITLLKNYSEQLRDICIYYENQITTFNQQKEKLEQQSYVETSKSSNK